MNSRSNPCDIWIIHLACPCSSKVSLIVAFLRVANTNIVEASDWAVNWDTLQSSQFMARSHASSKWKRSVTLDEAHFIGRCRFEKQARLKQLANFPRRKADETATPSIIPMLPSQETKVRRNPVLTPIRPKSSSREFSCGNQTVISLTVFIGMPFCLADQYGSDFDGKEMKKQTLHKTEAPDWSRSSSSSSDGKSKSSNVNSAKVMFLFEP